MVGLFFLLVVSVLFLLIFRTPKQEKVFSGQSFEQLLATLPEHPATDPESAATLIVQRHAEKLLPQLDLTLNGPDPLSFRLTKRLSPELRNRLAAWLPSSTVTRLFMTDSDLLLIRERCLQALSLIPEKKQAEVIDILTMALDRPEPALQRGTIRELGEFGSDAKVAVPRLIPFLKSLDQPLRYQATKTLGMIGPSADPAIEIIQNLMSDSSEMVRAAAVVSYGRIVLTHDSLVDSLLTALTDTSSQVRSAAAQVIGRTAHQDHRSILPLISALQDRESHVRRNAAIAIGRIGPAAKLAVDPLSKALWDERMEVRISAAEALGEIGPGAKSAIPHLFDALNNDFAGMGVPAHEAIKKIDPASDKGISAR